MWYIDENHGIFNIKPYFKDILILKDEDYNSIQNNNYDYNFTQSEEFNEEEQLYYAKITLLNVDQNKINNKIKEIRKKREKYLKAFDIYKQNVNYGIIQEQNKQHKNILSWYRNLLDLPEQINDTNYNTINFPKCPEEIKYYLKDKEAQNDN